jgi:hypothetical protein
VTDGAIDASVPSQTDITLLTAHDLTTRGAIEDRHKAAPIEEDDRLLLLLET